LNRKDREEHEERKGFSLHDIHRISFVFFAILAVGFPASMKKPSGVFGFRGAHRQ
jgi:hypothetical protein